MQSFGPYDKFDIKRVTDTCRSYYQTCQESWHPNAAGHQALGRLPERRLGGDGGGSAELRTYVLGQHRRPVRRG